MIPSGQHIWERSSSVDAANGVHSAAVKPRSIRSEAEYEIRDGALGLLPARTRLYPLKPIGVGTPFVESLSGYVSRLAAAHAVSVSDLLRRELLSFSETTWTSFGQSRQINVQYPRGYYVGQFNLNGSGKNARDLIKILEESTNYKSLRFTTLSPFDTVLTCSGISRNKRYWCPRCYEDWLAAGSPIYEPLLWTIDHVTVCHVHRQPLKKKCPSCMRESKCLSAHIRPGHCAFCNAWLGSPSHQSDYVEISNDLAFWYAVSIGELIAISPSLFDPSSDRVFKRNLLTCIQVVTAGNLLLFAKLCGIPKSSLWLTLQSSGRSSMSIDMLLIICRRLNIPATAFFEKDSSSYWAHAARVAKIEKTSKLELFAPKRQRSRISGQLPTMRMKLEKILIESSSITSVGQVERAIGISQGRLSRLFPEIHKQLAERCLMHRRQAISLRRSQLTEEVWSIVRDLTSQKKAATTKLVRSLLQPNSTRHKTVLSEAIKAAKSHFQRI